MSTLELRFTLDAGAKAPVRASEDAAGLDLTTIRGGWCRAHSDPIFFDSGVHAAIPSGCVGIVVGRSSLAKRGVQVANCVGIIDADYRGSIKIALRATGDKDVHIDDGERLAQLVVIPLARVTPRHVTELDTTARGEGGFGSTGRKAIE